MTTLKVHQQSFPLTVACSEGPDAFRVFFKYSPNIHQTSIIPIDDVILKHISLNKHSYVINRVFAKSRHWLDLQEPSKTEKLINFSFKKVGEEQSLIFSDLNTWKLPRTLQSHTMQVTLSSRIHETPHTAFKS